MFHLLHTSQYNGVYQELTLDHILHKVPSTTRNSSRKYPTFTSRIDSYMQSFFPRAIRLWNHLPDHLVETDNVDTFKSLLLLLTCIY